MLLQDLKYAIRSLVFDRGVTAVVVLCLALGIGINATLFSMVDGVLIKSLPYADAERLLILNETFERGGIREAGVSYPGLQEWKRQTTTLSAIVAVSSRTITLADRAEPEQFGGAAISWDLFPMLGIPPALGRHFTPQDDQVGAEPVVVISDDVWRRRYNGDVSTIGRSVSVNGLWRDARDRLHSLQRDARRPDQLHRRGAVPYGYRLCCQLLTGQARDRGRSDRRASERVMDDWGQAPRITADVITFVDTMSPWSLSSSSARSATRWAWCFPRKCSTT